LAVGMGCAFSPGGSQRWEVECSTLVAFAYASSHEWRPGVSKKKAKAVLAQYNASKSSVIAELERVRLSWRNRWTRRRLSSFEGNLSALPPSESAARAAHLAPELSQGKAPEPYQSPPDGFSSVIWPWQESELLVHRLAVCCEGLSVATRSRWAESLRSWREPWLQVLWVYEVADLCLLGVSPLSPHPHLLIRDASVVMPAVEWSKWVASGRPIPLIKQMFQLKCLHMFGGWWADMDYFLLNAKPPAASWSTWMLATECERRAEVTKTKWEKK